MLTITTEINAFAHTNRVRNGIGHSESQSIECLTLNVSVIQLLTHEFVAL